MQLVSDVNSSLTILMYQLHVCISSDVTRPHNYFFMFNVLINKCIYLLFKKSLFIKERKKKKE